MKEFRVDLHLHTCLSPCGSLEMSPRQIVETALEQGLDAIAVTDHNSTLQCPEIQTLGEECGLVVFAGAEVTTREEAHCVALFLMIRLVPLFRNIWKSICRLSRTTPNVLVTRSG